MFKILPLIVLMALQIHAFCADTVPDLTAVYDSRNNTVKIKWQNKLPEIKTFVIQRSSDNRNWADISMQTINNNTERSFYFEDKKPSAGENYYRLRYFTNSDKEAHSLGVMVTTGSPGYNWVMYPVPVTNLVTLQYKGAETIKGVITVLIQRTGKVLTRLRCASLSRSIQVPVSNLGSGIYDISITVENEVIWNQRFVK